MPSHVNRTRGGDQNHKVLARDDLNFVSKEELGGFGINIRDRDPNPADRGGVKTERPKEKA